MKLIILILASVTLEWCGNDYEPVCGGNSVTYQNTCQCHKANQIVAYVGHCKMKKLKKWWLKNTDDHGNWNNHRYSFWKPFVNKGYHYGLGNWKWSYGNN